MSAAAASAPTGRTETDAYQRADHKSGGIAQIQAPAAGRNTVNDVRYCGEPGRDD